jgi:hypothetical protein
MSTRRTTGGGRVIFDANCMNQHVLIAIIQWQDRLPRTVHPTETASAKARFGF